MKSTKVEKDNDILDKDFAKFIFNCMEFGFLLDIDEDED